jgi:hypothetical protein
MGKKKSQRGAHLPKLNKQHPKTGAKRTLDCCSDDSGDGDYYEDGAGSCSESSAEVGTTALKDPAQERRRRQQRESQRRSRSRKRAASAPPAREPSAKAQGIAAFFSRVCSTTGSSAADARAAAEAARGAAAEVEAALGAAAAREVDGDRRVTAVRAALEACIILILYNT